MKTLGAVLLVLAAASGWAADSADPANGKKVYGARCASCHGKDGKGNPGMAKIFKVDPAALDLTGAGARGKTDEELIGLVSKGKNKMPAFTGKLKDREISEAVAYFRGLGSAVEAKPQAKEEVKPAGDAAAAADGAGIYKAQCVSCHGAGGKGNPAMGKVFKLGPEALDLADAATTGRSDAELAEVLRKGKGRMPAYAAKLTDAEIAALISYTRSLAPK